MNYEEEKRRYISFCGSYCRTCDWHTGEIREVFQKALDMMDLYGGFSRLLGDQVDKENFKLGLKLLSNATIDSGCKAEIGKNPEEDRCRIRQCCFGKGYDLCSECSDFPCELLKTNPGVIKFGCIENLIDIRETGLEAWVDRQWRFQRAPGAL
jgi:hypothetical protein